MAVVTIRADGAGDYTSATAAIAAGAVHPADEARYAEAGTYLEQLTGLSAPPANVSFTNASGGAVVLREVAGRVSYMLTLNTGVSFADLTIQASGASYVRLASATAVSGWAFRRCAFVNLAANALILIRSTGATLGGLFEDCSFVAGALISPTMSTTGTVTVRRCRHGAGFLASGGSISQMVYEDCDASATTSLWVCSHAGCSVSITRCSVNGTLARASSANAGTVVIESCGATAVNAAVSVGAGRTIASLDVRRSYAIDLVANDGTITAFAGEQNAYVSTAVGTTSADDRAAASSADFRLGGPSGLEPQAASALLDVIPVGVQTGEVDLLGFPRLEGGRQTVGPVQARLPRARGWRRAA